MFLEKDKDKKKAEIDVQVLLQDPKLTSFPEPETQVDPASNINTLLDKVPSFPEEPIVIPGPVKAKEKESAVDPLAGLVSFPGKYPRGTGELSRSNVLLGTFESDGRIYVLPTMEGGKRLSDPFAVATEHGLSNYPQFDSEQKAQAWIKENHGNIVGAELAPGKPEDKRFVSPYALHDITPAITGELEGLGKLGVGGVLKEMTKPVYNIGGGVYNSLSGIAHLVDRMGEEVNKRYGTKGGEWIGELSEILAEKGAGLQEQGLGGQLGKIYNTVGSLGIDIPSIVALGPWGLSIFGALMGGADEGVKGAVKGGVHGAIFHTAFKFLNKIPLNQRLPAAAATGAGLDPEDPIHGALLGMGFGAMGGKRGQRLTLEDLTTAVADTKAWKKVSEVRAKYALRKLGVSNKEMKEAGGAKKLMKEAIEIIDKAQKEPWTDAGGGRPWKEYYRFLPKDAPELWYDIMDYSNGKGIAPFADAHGKVSLEEWRLLPKVLRNRKGVGFDEIATDMGFHNKIIDDPYGRSQTYNAEDAMLIEINKYKPGERARQAEAEADLTKGFAEEARKVTQAENEAFIKKGVEILGKDRMAQIYKELSEKKKVTTEEVKKRIEQEIKTEGVAGKEGEEFLAEWDKQAPKAPTGEKPPEPSTKPVGFEAQPLPPVETKAEGKKLPTEEQKPLKTPYNRFEGKTTEELESMVKYGAAKKEAQAELDRRYTEEPGTGEDFYRVTKEMEAEIAEESGRHEPGAGLSTKKLTPAQQRQQQKKPAFKYEDPEMEASTQEGMTRDKDPYGKRFKRFIVDMKNKVTRTYQHLENTAEWAPAKTALKILEKQKPVQMFKSFQALQGITVKLNDEGFNLFQRKVRLDDAYEDAKSELKQQKGYTKKNIEHELRRLDKEMEGHPEVARAIKKRNKAWDALIKDYIKHMGDVGVDLSKKLVRKSYFRHQIKDYLEESARGGQVSIKTPTGKSYTKTRTGTEKVLYGNYLEVEGQVITDMLYDIEVVKTAKFIKEKYDISTELKTIFKNIKKGKFLEVKGIPGLQEHIKKVQDTAQDWTDLVPPGYSPYHPREGHAFYLVKTVPEKYAEMIGEGNIRNMLNIKEGEFGPEYFMKWKAGDALAMGKKHPFMILPDKLTATLHDLTDVSGKGAWWGRGNRFLLTTWKQYTLLNPVRATKYNLRNLTGDLDATFIGNPSIFSTKRGWKNMGVAIKELYDAFYRYKPMTKDMNDWFEMGGMETLLQSQEMGQVSKLPIFKNLVGRKGAQDKESTFSKYWRGARKATDYREAILRYANYRDFLQQIEADIKAGGPGRPKSFGASIPEEIMALPNTKWKAFRLSNELLGAYDEIGEFGQMFRAHAYPFWSFREINARRYVRFFRNAANNQELTSNVGHNFLKATGQRMASPFMYLRVGALAVRVMAMRAAIEGLNRWGPFSEGDEQLSTNIQRRTHITLSSGKDGKPVNYFTRVGLLTDMLEWGGMDDFPEVISEIVEGKKTIMDVAKNVPGSFLNEIVQGFNPFYKHFYEQITKKALFPDWRQPRPIRDPMLHLAESLALGDPYRWAADIPSKPVKETIKGLVMYTSDPIMSGSNNWHSIRGDLTKKTRGARVSFGITPASNALYWMKLAKRYGDEKMEKKYADKYAAIKTLQKEELGWEKEEIDRVVERGIKASLKAMHPLAGLSKDELKILARDMTKRQARDFFLALRFYNEVLEGPEFNMKGFLDDLKENAGKRK